jgi:hypothetical protein
MAEWTTLPSSPTSTKVVAGITQTITQIVTNTKTQTVANTLTHTVANTLTQTIPNTLTHVETVVDTLTQTIPRATTVPVTVTLSGSLTTVPITFTPTSSLATSTSDTSTDTQIPEEGTPPSQGVLYGIISGLVVLGFIIGGFLLWRWHGRVWWQRWEERRQLRRLQRMQEERGIELEEHRHKPVRMEARDESRVGRNSRVETQAARDEGEIGRAI